MFEFISKRISTVYYIAFSILIIVALAIIWSLTIVEDGRINSRLSLETIESLNLLLSDIKRSESIQREFITTNNDELLKLYNLKSSNIKKNLPVLRKQLRFPNQLPNFDELSLLIEDKFDHLNFEINEFQTSGLNEVQRIISLNSGIDLTNEIGQKIEEIKSDEVFNLRLNVGGFNDLGIIVTIFILSGGLITLGMIYYGGKKIKKGIDSNEELSKILADKNKQLEDRNKEYEIIAEKLKVQNDELKDKTDKLAELNKKMIDREMQMINLKKQLEILKSE